MGGKTKDRGSDRGRESAPTNDRSSRDKDSGKGSKGKGRSEFNKSLKLRACDPAFGLRRVLIGEGGANVKHIQEQCNAKVSVREDNGEMRVEIGADSQDALKRADSMVKDLISVAFSDYDKWKGSQGKGKGKRGRDDNDERPSKMRRH